MSAPVSTYTACRSNDPSKSQRSRQDQILCVIRNYRRLKIRDIYFDEGVATTHLCVIRPTGNPDALRVRTEVAQSRLTLTTRSRHGDARGRIPGHSALSC